MAKIAIKKLLDSDSPEERTSKANSNFMNLFNLLTDFAGLDSQVNRTSRTTTRSLVAMARLVDEMAGRFSGFSDGQTIAQFIASKVGVDHVASRVKHQTRDAWIVTWASGKVEVYGTIVKDGGGNSVYQLPSITDFKSDATYDKAYVNACNGDATVQSGTVIGASVKKDGTVYAEWRSAVSGNARVNFHYILW